MSKHTHGWIRVRGIRVEEARVGVYPHEKEHTQPILIDVGLWAPLLAAARSESLRDTIDYSMVARTVAEHATSRHFPLLETLCDALVTILLDTFPAERVQVEVHKPWALPSGTVSIAMERHR